MPPRGTSRSKAKARMGWWLGPVIAYVCMLAAMLLFGLVVTPFKISAGVLTVVEQWVVYAIPIALIYLHVRRFERGKKFWQSAGVRRKNLGQSLIWVFALFVIFTGIMAVYWGATTSAMGEDPREAVDAHFEGENFKDLNCDGKYDPGENFEDLNGNDNYDLGEPFEDSNGNGEYDRREPFEDFNDNGERDPGFPNWYFGYMLFASFIPVALSEELIFRGFTLDRFLVKGPIFAILASSIMFSSLHL